MSHNGPNQMGAIRAATRRKNGYWARQSVRTAANLRRRALRHAEQHPKDAVATAYRDRRGYRA